MKQILAVCTLAVIGGSCGGGEKATTPTHTNDAEGMNVVVLTLDTLRSDALGCYGNPDQHTPAIDALAARGTVFQKAMSPIATTFPSHASMFTSLYPRAHGVRWNGDSLAEDYLTLAEILDGKGYDTGAFVSYKAMVTKGGMDQGFDRRSDIEVPRGAEGIRSGAEVNELAFAYLDDLGGNAEQGTFLWLHYFEPHSPYLLTDYADANMGDYTGPLRDGATLEEFFDLNKKENRHADHYAALDALYHGRVRDCDALVGEVVAGLEQRGMLDNTILVLIGDHGQLLGEHDRVGHGSILWQDALDVPFVIVDPRSPKHFDVETRVNILDMMPTLLELLELEAPDGLQGRSLTDAMRGEEVPNQLVFAEVRIADPRQARPKGQRDAVAVYHEQFKFQLEGDKVKLYDLVADPGETIRVSLSKQKELVEQLRPFAERHREMNPEAARSAGEVSEEMLAELESLGYAGGDED